MSESSDGGQTGADEFFEGQEPLFEEPVRTGSQGYEHEPPFATIEPADESTEFGSSEGYVPWGGAEDDGPTSDDDSDWIEGPDDDFDPDLSGFTDEPEDASEAPEPGGRG